MLKRYLAVCLLLIGASACNLSDDGPTLADTNNDSNNTNNDTNNAVCDECGVCDEDPTNDCVQDCAGAWGGEAMEDACGVCDADPSNDCVADCAGNPGGDAVEDMCGMCDTDPSNDCVQDCAGEWGGVAVVDMCGTCDAEPSNDCVQDCAGEWGGIAIHDACGRCVEGSTGLAACPTAVFTPVEDAHVHSTTPDSNFGLLSELEVDSQAGQVFLKFDLSSLPSDIVIRSLRLGGTVFETQSFGGSGEIMIHPSGMDTWSETTLTWNTRPRLSTNTIGTLNVAGAMTGTDTFVEMIDQPDFTTHIQNEVWGDKIVTLVLDAENYRANFYSHESGDASKHFQLEIAYQELQLTDLPVVADTFVRSGAPNKNFGTETMLQVDLDRSMTMVKFDLGALPDGIQIERVSLELLAYSGFAYGGDGNVYTHLMDDDTWDETSVTYATAPSFQVDTLGYWWLWYNNNAVDQWGVNNSPLLVQPLKDAYASDKLISFWLESPGYRTEYRSREWTDSAMWPHMKVYYTVD